MSVKELRTRKKMSQQELANQVGIKQSTVSLYETGARTPDLRTAKKMADVLGVSIDTLFLALNISK